MGKAKEKLVVENNQTGSTGQYQEVVLSYRGKGENDDEEIRESLETADYSLGKQTEPTEGVWLQNFLVTDTLKKE